MTGDLFESIIELTDGAGSRRLLPLRALQFGITETPLGTLVSTRKAGSSPHAGLWIGTVTLDQVSSVPETPPGGDPPVRPTVSSRLDVRLLVHVANDGQARLLKEVIQMWEDGTTANNPGRFVLITDDHKISSFKGSALAGNEQVGRRVSSIAFDFDDASVDWDDDAKALLLNGGTFGAGGTTLSTTITLPRTHPSNPFYHRYHPTLGDDCGCAGNAGCIAACDAALQLDRAVDLAFDARRKRNSQPSGYLR